MFQSLESRNDKCCAAQIVAWCRGVLKSNGKVSCLNLPPLPNMNCILTVDLLETLRVFLKREFH